MRLPIGLEGIFGLGQDAAQPVRPRGGVRPRSSVRPPARPQPPRSATAQAVRQRIAERTERLADRPGSADVAVRPMPVRPNVIANRLPLNLKTAPAPAPVHAASAPSIQPGATATSAPPSGSTSVQSQLVQTMTPPIASSGQPTAAVMQPPLQQEAIVRPSPEVFKQMKQPIVTATASQQAVMVDMADSAAPVTAPSVAQPSTTGAKLGWGLGAAALIVGVAIWRRKR